MTKEEYKFIEAVFSEMKKGYISIDDSVVALRAIIGLLSIISMNLGFTLTEKDLDDVLGAFSRELEHKDEKE